MQHDHSVLQAFAGTAAETPRILIIEDNDTNALILRSMLRKSGHDSIVATDGVEGVDMAARLQPSLILMDLQMPRLDGFEALARIREARGARRPVVVAVTASASPEVHAACLTAGFDAVLAKPVLLAALSSMVRRFLPGS
jgi:CheY-like chemotaxis protein